MAEKMIGGKSHHTSFDAAGSGPAIIVTNTTAVTGKFTAITAISDAVFTSLTRANTTGLYSYIVEVSDEYLQAFAAFQDYPAMLQQSIALDFDTRFPDLVPPSLADCEAFCNALAIEVL